MRDRMRKIIITLLVVIAMLIGIMPFENREIRADGDTKYIVFDEDTVAGIDTGVSPYTNDGITLSGYDYGDNSAGTASLYGGDLIICHGEFTFSSSIGKISKIVIYTKTDTGRFPDGWTWNGETLTWEGDPSYSVTIKNESEVFEARSEILEITEMVFTVIVEDVTDISLSEESIELLTDETKTLTVIFEPSTATEKEVEWFSGDPSTATVDDNGVVTAVGEGITTIFATATNGTEDTSDDKQAECSVIVTYKEPEAMYPLWVGGKQVTSKNRDDILGDGGKAKYDPETETLTLDGAYITGSYEFHCILAGFSSGTLTISLTGDNTIKSKKAGVGISSGGIYSYTRPVVITGDGSLTILDFHNGITNSVSDITIKDTTLTFENCLFGISGIGKTEIDNSTVTILGCENEGIESGVIKIKNSKVYVTANEVGIYSFSGKLSISGDSYVSADTTSGGAEALKTAMISIEPFELDGVEIIEPEEAGIKIKPIVYGLDLYAVVDKNDNIAAKVVIDKTSISAPDPDPTPATPYNIPKTGIE
jgi:hypothetical protein